MRRIIAEIIVFPFTLLALTAWFADWYAQSMASFLKKYVLYTRFYKFLFRK